MPRQGALGDGVGSLDGPTAWFYFGCRMDLGVGMARLDVAGLVISPAEACTGSCGAGVVVGGILHGRNPPASRALCWRVKAFRHP